MVAFITAGKGSDVTRLAMVSGDLRPAISHILYPFGIQIRAAALSQFLFRDRFSAVIRMPWQPSQTGLSFAALFKSDWPMRCH